MCEQKNFARGLVVVVVGVCPIVWSSFARQSSRIITLDLLHRIFNFSVVLSWLSIDYLLFMTTTLNTCLTGICFIPGLVALFSLLLCFFLCLPCFSFPATAALLPRSAAKSVFECGMQTSLWPEGGWGLSHRIARWMCLCAKMVFPP